MFQSLLCMNAVFYACGMHSLRLSMKELAKGPICMHGTVHAVHACIHAMPARFMHAQFRRVKPH